MPHSIERRRLSLAAAAWSGLWALAPPLAGAAPLAGGEDAQAFRALRRVRGHFDGGRWNDDVDRWQGRKHVAMQGLAEQMLRAHAPATQLRQAMGEPDERLQPGQAAHARAVEQAQWLTSSDSEAPIKRNTATLWLYRWRGRHDQLAFALEHERVIAAGWLHDWE